MNQILFLIFLFNGIQANKMFEFEQKLFPRVKQAYKNKELTVINSLRENKISEEDFQIAIIAYKMENRLEVWAGNSNQNFLKIKEFEICASSGKPGPKRKQGDWQVPEGFYFIKRFNPVSSYHLSLEVSYPNASDRILAKSNNLGGDIMIHGACITIGCLPMTNEGIEEIYIYAVKARQNGQDKIPVYILPAEPGSADFKELIGKYKGKNEMISFWNNLEEGYQKFKNQLKPLSYSINSKGKYIFN